MCPAVTRLPGPCSRLSALAPAAAEVPTLVGGGSGPGAWPDHSFYSRRGGLGRQDWDAELGPSTNRAGGGERGGEKDGSWGQGDRALPNQTSSPSQSEEHRSALSLYDNLPDTVTPDGLQEISDTKMNDHEPSLEQMYQAYAPEQTQALMENEGVSEEKSQDQNPAQDKKHGQEPEPDSGADLMLNLQLWMSPPQHLTASPSPLSQTGCQAMWCSVSVQEPEQSLWASKVPPPVPLADPSASALRCLLTSLQQQIVRQREEYEERIVR